MKADRLLENLGIGTKLVGRAGEYGTAAFEHEDGSRELHHDIDMLLDQQAFHPKPDQPDVLSGPAGRSCL